MLYEVITGHGQLDWNWRLAALEMLFSALTDAISRLSTMWPVVVIGCRYVGSGHDATHRSCRPISLPRLYATHRPSGENAASRVSNAVVSMGKRVLVESRLKAQMSLV